jgi:hypothetical protein
MDKTRLLPWALAAAGVNAEARMAEQGRSVCSGSATTCHPAAASFALRQLVTETTSPRSDPYGLWRTYTPIAEPANARYELAQTDAG